MNDKKDKSNHRTSFYISGALFLLWLILLILLLPSNLFDGLGEGGSGSGGEGGATGLLSDDASGSFSPIKSNEPLGVKVAEKVIDTPQVPQTAPKITPPPPKTVTNDKIIIDEGDEDVLLVAENNDDGAGEQFIKPIPIDQVPDGELTPQSTPDEAHLSQGITGMNQNMSGVGAGKYSGGGSMANGTGAGHANGSGTGSGGGDNVGDGASTGASFYGIEVRGQNILFILDRSYSMGEPMDNGQTRIEAMKSELIKMISMFSSKENKNRNRGQFKLLFFSDDNIYYPHKNKVVRMNNTLEIKKCINYISSVSVDNSTNLLGATESFVSLLERDKIDSIFLLTDGDPTEGTQDAIMRHFREIKYNKKTRKNITVNCISIGQESDLLKTIAQENRISPTSPIRYKVVVQ